MTITGVKNIFKIGNWVIGLRTTFLNFCFSVAVFFLLLLGAGFGTSISQGTTIIIVFLALAIMLGLVLQIRFRLTAPSELEVIKLKEEVVDLKERFDEANNENKKLKQDIKLGRTSLLNIESISEINIAEMEYELQKHFDYYKEQETSKYGNWSEKDKVEGKVHRRMIGNLQTKCLVKAGVDLRDLRFLESEDRIICGSPVVKVTGVRSLSSEWITKVELREGGVFEKHWKVTEPDTIGEKMDNEFWENERVSAISETTPTDIKLLKLLTAEAKTRITSLLYPLGKKVEFVEGTKLGTQTTLGDLMGFNGNDTDSMPPQLNG